MSSRSAVSETRGSGRTVSKNRLRLWLKLLKATRMIESEVRENLRNGHDSTLPRFDVMAALARSGKGLRMSELSSALRVSNGNVTGIVDRLVEDGHIVRVPVEGDRRAMLVRLTGRGREEFEVLASHHEKWISDLLDGVTGSQATALLAQLTRITQRLEERENTRT